jgi:glucose-1-phosphate thymidylyltransferase
MVVGVVQVFLQLKSKTHKIVELLNSIRGEYEIVDLLKSYLDSERLIVNVLDRGTSWLGGGTVESLTQASLFVRTSQERLGQLIGSPHEAALTQGLINKDKIFEHSHSKKGSSYWQNLTSSILV